MPRLKILFADDDIPDEGQQDSESISKEKKELYKTVEILRLSGYKVKTTNKLKDTMNEVKRTHFDIAIIDLGWRDEENPNDYHSSAGWMISMAIEDADKNFKSKPTFQIIYSRQFTRNPSTSIRAAGEGKLPFYKFYDEPGGHALLAAVKFIEWHLYNPLERIRQIMFQSWEQPLIQQDIWFKLTMIFVSLSLILILLGAIGAIFWDLQVGTLTSVSSILTSAISYLLYRQSQSLQKAIIECQNQIETVYNNARAYYKNTSSP